MKVDRLVSIIMLLLDKERIGAQEFTISMAGIPVHGASGVGGGFEIMQTATEIKPHEQPSCISLC